MSEQKILQELNQLFCGFFKNKNLVITGETTAHDISDWDSFSHMELMSKIEEHFELQIPFSVIMEFNKVGDIVIYLAIQQQG